MVEDILPTCSICRPLGDEIADAPIWMMVSSLDITYKIGGISSFYDVNSNNQFFMIQTRCAFLWFRLDLLTYINFYEIPIKSV